MTGRKGRPKLPLGCLLMSSRLRLVERAGRNCRSVVSRRTVHPERQRVPNILLRPFRALVRLWTVADSAPGARATTRVTGRDPEGRCTLWRLWLAGITPLSPPRATPWRRSALPVCRRPLPQALQTAFSRLEPPGFSAPPPKGARPSKLTPGGTSVQARQAPSPQATVDQLN